MTIRPFGVLAVVLCVTAALQSQMQSLGRNDSFVAARLSAREIRQILDGVEQSAYDTPDSWQTELRLRHVDLGGSAGLLVQGTSMLCGGTGNCQTWVFRKSNDRWISMMAGDHAPIASGFAFGPGISRGIRDFTIVANLSATDSKRTTFRFDGKFYRAQ